MKQLGELRCKIAEKNPKKTEIPRSKHFFRMSKIARLQAAECARS